MKALALISSILILITSKVIGQVEGDIIGTWINTNENQKIQFYKKENKYFGKLVWLKEGIDESGNPLTDKNNPEEELRTRKIIGEDILKNLSYRGRLVWNRGNIYEFTSGKTYNCTVTLRDKDNLDIRTYFGLAILGRTQRWKRTEDVANL